MAFGTEDLMDIVAQLTGAHPMDNDHRRQMVSDGQVEILLEGLQLQGKDLEIIEGTGLVSQLLGVQVELRAGRFHVLPGFRSLVNTETRSRKGSQAQAVTRIFDRSEGIAVKQLEGKSGFP